jgi:hypothetical protein
MKRKKTKTINLLRPVFADFHGGATRLGWVQIEHQERTMIVKHPGTFEPEALARLGLIFDDAWESLAVGFEHTSEAARAAARSRLAGILLELVDQQLMTDNLKQRALIIFQTEVIPTRPAEVAAASAPATG